jgi:hypothetical protein
MPPARFLVDDRLRGRFGPRVDRLGAYLDRGDPLADAAVAELERLHPSRAHAVVGEALAGGDPPDAPDALRALASAVREPPFWWDPVASDAGAAFFRRSGVFGGIVLGARSIVLGYVAPGGNKPLMFSGQLVRAASRRLAETSRFVAALTAPGGLAPGAPGFEITVRVRLMHARVRRDLRTDPRWDRASWGEPINQHDLAATNLLFSTVLVDGLRRFGLRPTDGEVASYLHLWRYVGWLMGVPDALLCTNEAEGAALGEMIGATQAPPDDDARTLVRALLDSVAEKGRDRALSEALLRFQLGDALADDLGIPRRPQVWGLRGAARLFTPVDRLRSRLAFADPLLDDLGRRYWDAAVAAGLQGVPARFAMRA